MSRIIPFPALSKEKYGEFSITNQTTIYADKELSKAKELFISIVERATNYQLSTVISKQASIKFLFERTLSEESYIIDCSTEDMVVKASTESGAFYAVQSLRQLLNADILDDVPILTMHAVYIEDCPRLKWRGLMLDESRHIFGVDFVKRLIDMMSMLKLNVFHWHLTDNEGWRVQIKKYPKLTEIGATRRGTQHLAWGRPNKVEWKEYSGFYTQEEIKEIVSYAKARSVMVVPEIDVPAHFGAALAAYPYLSCSERVIDTPVKHGGKSDSAFDMLACAGKESTYQFIYDVIDELSELFPAPYFHIGGDEADKGEWRKCPHCQRLVKEKGLHNEEELQGYFTNKIVLYLKRKGKELIGWNEILKAENLDGNAIIQYWTRKRDKNAETYIADGKKAIISKHEAFYFDMPYAYANLKATYSFDMKEHFIDDRGSNVLGIEGALWTEWMRTPERVEFQTFPRLQALSEVCWTKKENMDYKSFKKRLKRFLQILDKYKVNYAPESIAESKRSKAKYTYNKFIIRDAHCEYKKAMAKSKRYR